MASVTGSYGDRSRRGFGVDSQLAVGSVQGSGAVVQIRCCRWIWRFSDPVAIAHRWFMFRVVSSLDVVEVGSEIALWCRRCLELRVGHGSWLEAQGCFVEEGD